MLKTNKKIPTECNQWKPEDLNKLDGIQYTVYTENEAPENTEYLCSVCTLLCEERKEKRIGY